MDQREFLQSVYGDTAGKFLCLWNLDSKKSAWFNDIDRAAGMLKVINQDVYVGIGLSHNDKGPHRRCRSEEVVGIPGFVCDIDIAGSSHAGKSYPPSQEEALAIVEGRGIDPTLVLHSGHGLQMWWLFKETWHFENGDNAIAAELSYRWGETLKAWAGERGYMIDSVYDLARILRPSNTWNCKNGSKVLTRTIKFDDSRRYNPQDFETFFVDPGLTISEKPIVAQSSHRTVSVGKTNDIDDCKLTDSDRGGRGTGGAEINDIMLDPKACGPTLKIEELIESEPKFKKTWEKERKDFKSASEYDYSIASYAANNGFTDQEIANSIIQWRRRRGESVQKAMRKDYIANTINKVKKNQQIDASNQILDSVVGGVEATGSEETNEELSDEKRAEVLGAVSAHWNISILKFEIYPSEETSYVLYLQDGTKISFKNNKILTTQNAFRERISNFTHRIVPSCSVKNFERNVDALMKAGIKIPESEDATREEQIKSLIRDYINNHSRLTFDEAVEMRRPFFDSSDQHWYIFTTHMVDWLERNRKIKTCARMLGVDLTFVGATVVLKYITADDGTPRKLKPKKIPKSIVL